MTGHKGSCHCGRIRLTLTGEPFEAAECNCSICRRLGTLWHYCQPAKVVVHGEGTAYIQGDCMLALWRCPDCGCVTHWTPQDPSYDRMGINLRMFEPSLWENLPRRLIDGASF